MSETKDNYPAAFLQRIKDLLGDEYISLLNSLGTQPPVSLRLNPYKPSGLFADEERVPWCEAGRYLAERPSFTFDPLFHAGAYYVQEAGSMFIEQLWRQINPEGQPLRILDMCAAPGGKSTHLLSLMNVDSLLVSNEVIPNRNHILQQNIAKWGTANSIVTQNEAADFSALPNYFDVILVDAPCSGEGLFRKDKNAVEEWSETNVTRCSVRQKDILLHAISCLKPGGWLIYSTCTYESSENDDAVSFALKHGMDCIPLQNPPEGLMPTRFGLQFMPHRVRSEGFFISLLRKQDNIPLTKREAQRKQVSSHARFSAYAESYLSEPERFVITEKKNNLYAIPQPLFADFQKIASLLYVRQAGIPLGTLKGNNLVPAPELALSNYLRRDLPAVDLNEEQAITYLRCESIKANSNFRGWVLARYDQFPLGWLKLMDGRSNNYYPKNWRIFQQTPHGGLKK